MDFPNSATVLLCTENPELASRWSGLGLGKLNVICAEDSQVALERLVLDNRLWLLAIDHRWHWTQINRLLDWLKHSQDARLKTVPLIVLADTLESAEIAPWLADLAQAIWRIDSSEVFLKQMFESAAASAQTYTQIVLEWQGEPASDAASPLAGMVQSANRAGRLRAGDHWHRLSANRWAVQLAADSNDVLAPLVRLSGQLGASGAKGQAENAAFSPPGRLIAYLDGAPYRLPLGAC